MKYCFIILHFLEGAIKDTIECVESIENNIKSENYSIIIIDNGSKDESSNILNEKFKNSTSIDVITSENNLGFAKGNNLGASYAKNKYNPEFLIALNNDTIINQSNFLKLIDEEYNNSSFSILGPYIYDANNIPQNPMQFKPIESANDIENKINKNKEILKKIQEPNLIWKLKRSIKLFMRKYPIFNSQILLYKMNRAPVLYDPDNEHTNVPLHGSALIFSKKFFSNKDYIFYPYTFLYVEEEILFYLCNRDNHCIRYQPKIKIHHKEDVSTDIKYENDREKIIFTRTHQINSYRVFWELVSDDYR